MSRRSGARVKAVFFDIGNVLFRFERWRFYQGVAWAAGLSPLTVAAYFRTENISSQLDRGEISTWRVYKSLRTRLGYAGTWRNFVDLWCGHMVLNVEMKAVLKEVSAHRRVYLLSNTNDLHYGFIRRRHAFVRGVDGAVLSYRLGSRKPESRIFKTALRRARVKAGEAVLVDDLEENVAVARRLGIRSILYEEGSDCRGKLAELGVFS